MNERLEAWLVVGKVVMSEGRVDLPENRSLPVNWIEMTRV